MMEAGFSGTLASTYVYGMLAQDGLIDRMKGHKERLFSVQFSPNGNRVLSSSWLRPNELMIKSRDTSIRLWDTSKEGQNSKGRGISGIGSCEQKPSKEVLRLKGFVAGGFDWSGNKIIAFEEQNSNVSLYGIVVLNAESGNKLHSVQLEEGLSPSSCRLDISWKGDMVICSGQASAHAFDLTSGLVLSSDEDMHQAPCSSQRVSSGGSAQIKSIC